MTPDIAASEQPAPPPTTAEFEQPATPRSGTFSADARRFLLRRAFLPVWVGLGVVAAGSALGTEPATELGFALLLFSILVVGLPHGAVDHHLVRRLLDEGAADRSDGTDAPGWTRSDGTDVLGWLRTAAHSRPLVAVGVVYLLLGGAYLLAWFLAPAAAFVGFILLTWVHWGLGDLYGVVAMSGGDHLRTRGQRALTAAVRGAIPMLVPLAAHPAEYRRVASLVVGAFDPAAAATLAARLTPRLGVAVAAALLVATTVSLALGRRGARKSELSGWTVDAGETLLLVGFFVVVPPVVAIGLYFPFWHSLRHVLRVQLLDRQSLTGVRTGRFGPAIVGFGRDASATTVGALLVFGGLFVAVPGATAGVEGLVSVYLVLLAVLTLPHAAIAVWADRRQGVWTTP